MSRTKPALSEVKPFASLSSGLLARKGGARPAMRAQAFGQLGAILDDLGWNDMGDVDAVERAPSSIAALTPAAGAAERDEPSVPTPSPVLEQQRVIEDAFADENAEQQAEIPAPAVVEQAYESFRQPAPAYARKSAFTLRLDHDRHLRLRLACAVQHRSAQRVVSAALDAYLDSLPELEEFVRQIPPTLGKQS